MSSIISAYLGRPINGHTVYVTGAGEKVLMSTLVIFLFLQIIQVQNISYHMMYHLLELEHI